MSEFNGTHDVTMNGTGRFSIPPPFRHDDIDGVLEGLLYVTPDSGGYLIVRPEVVWKKYRRWIMTTSLSTRDKKKLLENESQITRKISLDNSNRIVLPAKLREHLGLKEGYDKVDLKVTGNGNSFKIMLSENCRSEEELISENATIQDKLYDDISENPEDLEFLS
ncbi:hypothetical protein K8I28_08575 [bacterium]|nr:hypothetical protein [bacterium]